MKAMRVGENQLTLMLESCRSLLFTDWALHDSGVLAGEDIPESIWDLIPDRFEKNEEVQAYLKSLGRA
ncbi:hypothetical protein DL95DRAFT_472735 [Leptodontidium sp. 2 PMI_412]|nr:hypothetical protein DL95DRAFT_472788 [Leptodontidium sp. 2 PMI_412]KAH9203075.1 hypothetical protein DL95DRAFT_472735 [Leptodontidium sp. 2 PMI_412]